MAKSIKLSEKEIEMLVINYRYELEAALEHVKEVKSLLAKLGAPEFAGIDAPQPEKKERKKGRRGRKKKTIQVPVPAAETITPPATEVPGKKVAGNRKQRVKKVKPEEKVKPVTDSPVPAAGKTRKPKKSSVGKRSGAALKSPSAKRSAKVRTDIVPAPQAVGENPALVSE